MSKKAWSPGRMRRSLKMRMRRAALAETALMLSTCSLPMSKSALVTSATSWLADPRLEPLADELVGAVDHGHVQQHDLVLRLDLAGIEHGLLPVAYGDLAGLERRQHGRLHDVHADRHVGHALVAQDVRDLPPRRRRGPPPAPPLPAGRSSRRGCSPAAATGSRGGGASPPSRSPTGAARRRGSRARSASSCRAPTPRCACSWRTGCC